MKGSDGFAVLVMGAYSGIGCLRPVFEASDGRNSLWTQTFLHLNGYLSVSKVRKGRTMNLNEPSSSSEDRKTFRRILPRTDSLTMELFRRRR